MIHAENTYLVIFIVLDQMLRVRNLGLITNKLVVRSSI
jgi:hypothetical protein